METPAQDEEVVREFLVESYENLSRLDQEFVELEKRPKDTELLGSIFRTIHTIKGSCGFLAYSNLERITHQAESILSQLRDGKLELNPYLVSLILETVDATRKILTSIEAGGQEGAENFNELTERLRDAAKGAKAFEGLPDIALLAEEMAKHAEESGLPEHPGGVRTSDEGVKASAVADANIRVGVGLLDKLMDLVGELVLTRNQILQFNSEREDPALNATSQRLNLIATELQEGVMKTRMQPIGVVWSKLPRVVRDMSVSLGKQILLEMDGTETELDRTIIEAIKDPLVHLVRNACDHGIEMPDVRVRAGKSAQGTLKLRAYHEGGQVNIEIADDGTGINIARVKEKAIEKGILRSENADRITDREAMGLIFQPGFSTAAKITKLSGRGVGMDVVKSNIEKIGGVVDIFSPVGGGTTVKLKIPLTLAIIPGLVITSGGEQFVIPQVSLLELIRMERDVTERHIEHVHGTPVFRRRGSLLPVAYLNKVLGLKAVQDAEAVSMVVLQAEDRQFGLVVDGINDTQEIVVKPLSKQLKGLNFYAGSTIMGDGHVALILDVLGIGQRSGVFAESHEQSRSGSKQKVQVEAEKQRLLLFSAGSFHRLALPLSLVNRLEEFQHSCIENASGRQVVQYRDRILPLVTLQSLLGCVTSDAELPADPAQVIVLSDGEQSVGLVVDRILDVVEESITVRQKTGRLGLLGSAVVGGQVADFLDLNYVIHQATADWFETNAGSARGKTILVAEASIFARGLIRSGLDMAGYRVLEAGNLNEALRRLEQQPVDIVVAGMGLPLDGCQALQTAMKGRRDWERIPMLALADSAEQLAAQTAFEDCETKFDRESMLKSLARLGAALGSAEATRVCVGQEADRC